MDLENNEFVQFTKLLARRPQDLRDVIMIDDFLKLQNDAGGK